MRCAGEFITRCAGSIPDVQTFVRGTNKLLEVCDTPNLFPNTQKLLVCNKGLNASGPAFSACTEKAKTGMSSLKNVRDPGTAMELLRSGQVLRDACWYVTLLKKVF